MRIRRPLLTVLLAGGIYLAWVVLSDPPVGVTVVSNSAHGFVVKISSIRVEGASEIRIWSETKQEALWHLRRDFDRIKSLTYGVVPRNVKQLFPADESVPRRVLTGETIVIAIAYNYDNLMEGIPCVKTVYARCTFAEDGSVRASDLLKRVDQPSRVHFANE